MPCIYDTSTSWFQITSPRLPSFLVMESSRGQTSLQCDPDKAFTTHPAEKGYDGESQELSWVPKGPEA